MSVPASVCHPRRHAAAHTDEYVFCQIIPYLGNKRKLLPLIAESVALTGLPPGVFADLFAGSGAYLTRHFCPQDDDRPDPARERCLCRANGSKLDTHRARLAQAGQT